MAAAELVPPAPTLTSLRAAAAHCTACPLHLTGTQTVFGEGRATADVVLVGEQPGDQEDVAGRPFVGPAGRLLDRALDDAGIDRADVYVTNAVKHFKWTASGKRRIHQKPDTREVAACKPWLTAELSVLRPRLVVALGATAAQALLGKDFRVTKSRGQVFPASPPASRVVATVHPSSILRSRTGEERAIAYDAFVADLRVVAKELAG